MERTSETRALKYVTSLMRQIFRRSRVGGDDASKLWPRVSFLAPHGAERDLLSRRRYSGHFHSAFVGCSVTHFLQARMMTCTVQSSFTLTIFCCKLLLK